MLMTQPRVIHSVIMIEKVMLIIEPRVILIHSVIIREIVMVMIQQKSEARDKKRGGRWTADVIYSTFGQKLPPPSHLKFFLCTSFYEVWDRANIRYFQSLHSNVIQNQIKLKQLFISHSSFALWWCGFDQVFSTIGILSVHCPFGVGIGVRSDVSAILQFAEAKLSLCWCRKLALVGIYVMSIQHVPFI